MLPRIYLIRHGESEWSLSGRHTGCSDIPLTTRGEEEERALGRNFKAIPFAHVMVSPRERAQKTCDLVGLSLAAKTELDIAEWDYGEYEGQRSSEILALRPAWNCFRNGCPGGETPQQISHRADG